MFAVIMLRKGDIHIVDYTINNDKQIRTICQKQFSKKLKPNTLAADNTFPGMCKTCKAFYDEMYISDLNHDPRMARNESQFRYYHLLDAHRYEMEGPQVKFGDRVNWRWWVKLVKYQRLLQKR
jgi:hypothetical protein